MFFSKRKRLPTNTDSYCQISKISIVEAKLVAKPLISFPSQLPTVIFNWQLNDT